MTGGAGDQHLVFDAEIVDGLVYAWRARRELGLPAVHRARIAARIHRAARCALLALADDPPATRSTGTR